MTRQTIFETLIRLIAIQDPKRAESLTESSKIREDLDVDSIELMEFIINVEDEFKTAIPDEAIEEMATIADLIDYLLSKLK